MWGSPPWSNWAQWAHNTAEYVHTCPCVPRRIATIRALPHAHLPPTHTHTTTPFSCQVVWIVLVVALPFGGYLLLWAFLANFFMNMAVAALPFPTLRSLDSRVAPRAQVSPSAFPCVEVWLAASVFLGVAKVRRPATLCVGVCVCVSFFHVCVHVWPWVLH